MAADDDPMGDGRTVDDRVREGDEPEGELFPEGTLSGEGPTLASIVKKGLPVTLKFALTRKAVDAQGTGLFDPNRYGRALVTFLPGMPHPTALREDKHNPAKITGYEATQELRVTHVRGATDVVALLREEFEGLLANEPEQAGALLDDLQKIAAEALQPA